ncbi:kinase-like domain-containing protein [Mycena olivaceomarginata]|nr:kinase-like domain-containing protein [Mycena olivaceomarginata]
MDSSDHQMIALEQEIRYIPLSYNSSDSEGSALALVKARFPEWDVSEIEFVRLTQGINNTLLKVVRKRPGLTKSQIDKDALLLRAYGTGTEILIDREREISCHSRLSEHGLASTLLARFKNGFLYGFVIGKACSEDDITQERIWRGVARTMGHWHAVVSTASFGNADSDADGGDHKGISMPGKPVPNIWTLMQKWVHALPARNPAEEERQAKYQTELERLVKELGDTPGLGGDGLVFAHNDLLAGNIVVRPAAATSADSVVEVDFIDYEYATPAPAAFEICSHFAEWAGYKCDYNLLPTKSTRREFLREYIRSYDKHLGRPIDEDPARLERFCKEVDAFRAIPSFFWGICSLIQASISEFDFNHNEYSEMRLSEYWAWREEMEGARTKLGKEMTLRERRWAQEH